VTAQDEQIIDAEIVEEHPARSRGELVRARTRVRAVRLARGAHAVVTHHRTKTAARGSARNLGYVLLGAGVVAQRVWEAKTNSRQERAMRAAEAAGDWDRVQWWAEHGEKARQQRHTRRMDLLGLPGRAAKALLIGACVWFGCLLLLGIVMAIATGHAGAAFAPILAFVHMVQFLAWLVAVGWLPGLLGIAALALFVLHWLGRAHAERMPAWMQTARGDADTVVVDERAIAHALRHLGVPAIRQYFTDGGVLGFTRIPARDGELGVQAQVRMPPGSSAADVIRKTDLLAANLGRAGIETWPSVGEDQGLLDLWVADRGALDQSAGPWPWITASSPVNVFEGVPVGRTLRGDQIIAPIDGASWLIGGRPGQGKSTFGMLLVAGAALDPTAEIWCYVLADNADFDPLAERFTRYEVGLGNDVAGAALGALGDLMGEMEHRGQVMRQRKAATAAKAGFHPLMVLMDECFPAGTLVGGVPIEQLAAGDVVPSWDSDTEQPCYSVVARVFQSKPHALVRVHWINGTSLVCTPGHPLMTRNGWRAAGSLSDFDEVLCYGPSEDGPIPRDLHDLRKTIPPATDASRLLAQGWPGVLQPRLLAHWSTQTAAGEPDRDGACRSLAAHEGTQPHVSARDTRQGGGFVTRERAQASAAGRQWSWSHRTSAATLGDAGVANRGDCANGQSRERRPTHALQARYREPGHEGCCRGGRYVALRGGTSKAGSAQAGVASWRRVDRIEVLQPGSDGRYGGLCPDGFVYNLEVAGTHVYRVADGVVAHNCHRLFQHREYGREAGELGEDVIKQARKYGIVLMLLTQSPTSTSIPKGISREVICRVAFSVVDHVGNDALLGTGKHARGIRATELRPGSEHSPGDRGKALTVGVVPNVEWAMLIGHHLSGADLAAVGKRAEQHGRPARAGREQRDLLADLDAVLGGEPVPAADVPALLRDLAPDWAPYARMSGKSLRDQLASLGVRVPSTDRRYPVDPGAVREAIARRAE
jgi:hypothetical protein